jgi:hypothetical protein
VDEVEADLSALLVLDQRPGAEQLVEHAGHLVRRAVGEGGQLGRGGRMAQHRQDLGQGQRRFAEGGQHTLEPFGQVLGNAA